MKFLYMHMDTWCSIVTGYIWSFEISFFLILYWQLSNSFSDLEYIIVILLGTLSTNMYNFRRYPSTCHLGLCKTLNYSIISFWSFWECTSLTNTVKNIWVSLRMRQILHSTVHNFVSLNLYALYPNIVWTTSWQRYYLM